MRPCTIISLIFLVLALFTVSFAANSLPVEQTRLEPGQSLPVSWSSDNDPRWHAIETAKKLFSFRTSTDVNDWRSEGCWIKNPDRRQDRFDKTDALFVAGDYTQYPNDVNERVFSPTLTLPLLSYKSCQILLTLDEWYQLESGYDFGFVEISTDRGSHWQVIDSRSGFSSDLQKPIVDLTWFAGKTIQLAFRLSTNSNYSFAGWSINSVTVYQTTHRPINQPSATDELISSMVNINSQRFPMVFSNVNVTFNGTQVNGLTADAFRVTENSVLQTDLFTVIPPDSNNGNRLADIVFVLDVTGSMAEEIESVRQNMASFISALVASEVNCNIGFVVFGDIVYRYNEGNLYTDWATIQSLLANIRLGEHNIGSGGDTPENQLGAIAVANSMNFRPGAQRNLILLTDAPSHGNDAVTSYTTAQVQALLVDSHTILFPIFDTNNALSRTQYITLAQATNPYGTYFNVYANFNSIISQISSMISNTYLISYRSTIPAPPYNLRTVAVQTTYLEQLSNCTGTYYPSSAPSITRTEQTFALHTQTMPANSPITISVNVIDHVAPFVQQVTLFYRSLIVPSYSQANMTVNGSSYVATIPATAVVWPGVQYYVSASDNQLTTTDPSSNPTEFPYTLAVTPNSAPRIEYTPVANYTVTGGLNNAISIDATINDTTVIVMRARLFYRVFPNLLYQTVEMIDSTNNLYHGEIPAGIASNQTIEYVLYAEDENCIAATIGTFDQPAVIQPAVRSRASDIESNGLRSLSPVSPNPFHETATISYTLSSSCIVSLSVYDQRGYAVMQVPAEFKQAGTYRILFDGSKLSSGEYTCQLNTGHSCETRKMVLLK
ncbi:MAG: VWA domain-containing protein [bacterium]|nr:VWA domain-containing protein [bacterium]